MKGVELKGYGTTYPLRICQQCKLPWALHPVNDEGEYVCHEYQIWGVRKAQEDEL